MIEYFHLTVILSVIMSGVFLVRWRKGISVHFPMVFLFIPIINLGYLKVATAQNLEEALLANGVEYLDGCFLQLIFFLYIISFCKLKIPKVVTVGLLTIGAVIFFFAINDAEYHLLYSYAELRTLDGASYLVKKYGPIHTYYYIMIAVYLVANLSAIIYSFTRKNVSKINTIRLLLIYIVVILAFLVGKPIHPALELLPLSYTISQFIFLIVLSKINLYDVSESAMANVAERGDLGFATFDLKLRYMGCTDPVLAGLPELGALYVDKTLKPENETFKKILRCLQEVQNGKEAPFFYVSRNDISYKVTCGYLYFGGKLKGYQLRIEENTEESRRLEALKLREQQKEIEARMLKLEKSEADAANRAKSRFLAEMSHEIRTPINAIIGMNEMILRTSKDAQTLEYSASIASASKTLLSLINSILDFSKIEDGKMEISPVRYQTSTMIQNLTEAVRERVNDKGLTLALDIDDSLPSKLFGDDVRVEQIILNLLTNAVKYTEKGTVTLSVRDGGRDSEGIFLEVSVKDTGIGIRQEDMTKLFESFERLDEKRNRNIEGTGLGMSIVSKLLAMMDSKLRVESVYGEGSVFSFRLRQGIADPTPINTRTPSTATGTVQTLAPCKLYAPSAKVLVVDDNQMNLKVAKNLLGLFGIVPQLASSGFEAIELITRDSFMVVFLDHMMPEMDGIETLKRLRDGGCLKGGIKVIALSANAISGAREGYLAAGFDDYLSKPIEIRGLEDMLKKHLPESVMEERSLTGGANVPGAGQKDITIEGLPKAISVEKGMESCMKDEELYREMLMSFSDTADETEAKLGSFLEQGDMENYCILVHSLKSSARTIGAIKLGDEAERLENAARDSDRSTVENGHGALCRELRELAQGIGDALRS